MKVEVGKGDFRDAFKKMDRDGGWSYEGLGELYDYLEEAYDGDYLLDVIELDSSYVEYENLAAFNSDLGWDYEDVNEVPDLVVRVGSEGFIVSN